ncbi:MAG: hypothetical protein GF364_14385 [Candidatus Lokiarchaeota archaeon]|nr:hypothetical protein [Candidatus Lokiarchaeota archaeon]
MCSPKVEDLIDQDKLDDSLKGKIARYVINLNRTASLKEIKENVQDNNREVVLLNPTVRGNTNIVRCRGDLSFLPRRNLLAERKLKDINNISKSENGDDGIVTVISDKSKSALDELIKEGAVKKGRNKNNIDDKTIYYGWCGNDQITERYLSGLKE